MRDLRTWIQDMDAAGLLREVRGADWDLEIGAITDLNAKAAKWALLFDEIRGYPAGYRILTGAVLDARRVSYALGADTGADEAALVAALRGRLYREGGELARVPPREVADAPMFEHRHRGEAVDLLGLPAPRWHEHDGGRYLGTFDAVITRDPEEGWVNLGAYRLMVHSANRLCLFVNASHHARLHMEKYARRGEAVPVAVSLGHDPALSMLAGMEVPTGVSELEAIGGLRDEPVEVVPGPVTGLPLPVGSECVVEGFLSDETVQEGPFGEFLGYYAGGKMTTPTIEVAALYHRGDPILLGTCSGIPPYDYSYFRCPLRAAMLWEQMDRAGVPGVAGVWCHEAGYSRALNVVAIDQQYQGHAQQAGMVASQARAGAFGGKYTIVVDDDVDPANLEEVMWAVCTRTDPASSIEFLRSSWGMALDPMVVRGPDDALNELSMSRAVIDACRPLKRAARGDWPAVVRPPAAVADRVRARFGELFEAGR